MGDGLDGIQRTAIHLHRVLASEAALLDVASAGRVVVRQAPGLLEQAAGARPVAPEAVRLVKAGGLGRRAAVDRVTFRALVDTGECPAVLMDGHAVDETCFRAVDALGLRLEPGAERIIDPGRAGGLVPVHACHGCRTAHHGPGSRDLTVAAEGLRALAAAAGRIVDLDLHVVAVDGAAAHAVGLHTVPAHEIGHMAVRVGQRDVDDRGHGLDAVGTGGGGAVAQEDARSYPNDPERGPACGNGEHGFRIHGRGAHGMVPIDHAVGALVRRQPEHGMTGNECIVRVPAQRVAGADADRLPRTIGRRGRRAEP